MGSQMTGVQGRQHVGQPVENAEILQGPVAPHVVQVPDEGGARHGHEDRPALAEGDGLVRIAGVKGDRAGDRRDQLHDQGAVEIDSFTVYLGPCPAPIVQGRGIAEVHADLLEDRHGGIVDPRDLLLVEGFGIGQPVPQAGQHVFAFGGAKAPARIAPASPNRRRCNRHRHTP
jgi:hypothetical protein